MQAGEAAIENSMESPQKTKNGTTFWPSDSTAGNKPKEKNLCIYMFVAVPFIIAQIWKQPKCPLVDEWIKKRWYIYTMEYYVAERKKEFLPVTTAWMELETIMLCEISQLVKDKYYMISLIRGT